MSLHCSYFGIKLQLTSTLKVALVMSQAVADQEEREINPKSNV